jgi:hypothetical protein
MSAQRPPRILANEIQATIDGFPDEVRQEPGRLRFTLAVTIISHFLGRQWCEDNILQDVNQTRPAGFLRVNFTPGFEGERKNARILDLAENLFNLQHIEGFDDRVDQLRTGDIESTIAELTSRGSSTSMTSRLGSWCRYAKGARTLIFRPTSTMAAPHA